MLLHKYLPEYHFHEVHHIEIKASVKDCFTAAKDLDMSPSFITKFLMRLRGLRVDDLRLQGFLKNVCFTYLEEDPYNEFVIDASRKSLKIFWNFSFHSISPNLTKVRTETRIRCLTKKSKLLFSIYWFFVRPFSGIIRLEILSLLKKKLNNAERGELNQLN